MKPRVVIYTLGFSPHKQVSLIPSAAACQSINEGMKIWGRPWRIKIDNGLPFVNPKNIDLPTLSQLWWIGLGIEVQLNALGVPQQNGTVEGLQGVCRRWSNPAGYDNIADYQERVDQTNRIQREVYRLRKQGDKTRKELYPQLWQNPRTYNPDEFWIDKVYKDLATRVWKRRIKDKGDLKFWKKEIYIGTRFKNQKVTITFDPDELQWMVRSNDGRLLKVCSKERFTEAQILEHAGISKN